MEKGCAGGGPAGINLESEMPSNAIHRPGSGFLRKEVIQPQVPLRLPCYDFTPVTSHTIGGTTSSIPELVGQARFELATSRLSSARSNQLSY